MHEEGKVGSIYCDALQEQLSRNSQEYYVKSADSDVAFVAVVMGVLFTTVSG